MPDVSFTSLLVVALISLAAPLVIAYIPVLRVPGPVLLIVAGIAVGPSGLRWVQIDLPIQILSLLGLAFLLFLAGLEIDPRQLRGRALRLTGLGYAVSLAIGVAVGLLFSVAGFTKSPLLVGIALSATSLGLVVPVLKDAGQLDTEVGSLTVAGASIADFLAVVLLSVFFSTSGGGIGPKVILLGGFALLVVVAAVALSRLGRSVRLNGVLVMLQDTTAEIRVRFAVALLIGFVALASHFGLETILGAFIAGAILNFVDRDSMSHPNFRVKLDAIGYGFLIPVFFVASGLRLDIKALLHSPSAAARIPLFLLGLLVVRALPALLYKPALGTRSTVAAGLLQATSLPFLVTASQIGVTLGTIKPVTGAALVAAGVLSCVIFPQIALSLLRTSSHEITAVEGDERPRRRPTALPEA
jgi:Kef-type K+ transport system membrane component KefB